MICAIYTLPIFFKIFFWPKNRPKAAEYAVFSQFVIRHSSFSLASGSQHAPAAKSAIANRQSAISVPVPPNAPLDRHTHPIETSSNARKRRKSLAPDQTTKSASISPRLFFDHSAGRHPRIAPQSLHCLSHY